MPSNKLDSLPTELARKVVESLDFATLIALSQTCRFYRNVTELPLKECHEYTKTMFVAQAETFPQNRANGFGCYSCFRVLPRDRFGREQTKGWLEKGGCDAMFRFCFDCGLKTGSYRAGYILEQGDTVKMVCYLCASFREGRFCRVCLRCQECLGIPEGSDWPEECPWCHHKDTYCETPFGRKVGG